MMKKKKQILSLSLILTLLVSVFAFTALADEEKTVDQLASFHVAGAKMSLKAESIDFTLTEENASIQFVRPLASSGFGFRWNGVNDKAKKLKTMDVILEDSEDSECSVKLTFGQLSDESTYVKYNGGTRSYLTQGSTYKKNEVDISLRYAEGTNTFTDDAGAYQIQADNCLNGNAFEGFPSLGVNLTLRVQGKVGATFSLTSLNEQPLGSDYQNDTVDPVLCVPTGPIKMLYGSTADLPKAAAFDVFSDETSLTLTVEDPDGNVVKDESGKAIKDVDGYGEYRIHFEKYGQYRVTYVASDGVNATRGIGYQIYVSDTGAPEIQIKDKMATTVKVGEAFTFPELSLKDNMEGEMTSWVNVLHPEGYITCEKDSFTPDTEGTYTITFNAQDENGNVGRLSVKIYAEGSSES